MTYVKAKKLKMGQIFKEDETIPVTFVSVSEGGEEGFEIGSRVKVSGISRGKGFQGVVKRHGFHGSDKTHGQKHTLRAPGSIGSTGPQRVFPGIRMAGRTGGATSTTRNLEVVSFDKDRGLLALRGAVPGNNGGELKIYTK